MLRFRLEVWRTRYRQAAPSRASPTKPEGGRTPSSLLKSGRLRQPGSANRNDVLGR